jgi:hypothetical protein
MPSWYVSRRVMSDQTEHSRAIILGYVPSGHYFRKQTRPIAKVQAGCIGYDTWHEL